MKADLVHPRNEILHPLPETATLPFKYVNGKTIVVTVENYEDLPTLSRLVWTFGLRVAPKPIMNSVEAILFRAFKHELYPLTLSYFYDPKTNAVVYVKFKGMGIAVKKIHATLPVFLYEYRKFTRKTKTLIDRCMEMGVEAVIFWGGPEQPK